MAPPRFPTPTQFQQLQRFLVAAGGKPQLIAWVDQAYADMGGTDLRGRPAGSKHEELDRAILAEAEAMFASGGAPSLHAALVKVVGDDLSDDHDRWWLRFSYKEREKKFKEMLTSDGVPLSEHESIWQKACGDEGVPIARGGNMLGASPEAVVKRLLALTQRVQKNSA